MRWMNDIITDLLLSSSLFLADADLITSKIFLHVQIIHFEYPFWLALSFFSLQKYAQITHKHIKEETFHRFDHRLVF